MIWRRTIDRRGLKTSRELWRLWLFLFISLIASWAIWLSQFEGEGALHFTIFQWRITFSFHLIKLIVGNCIPGLLALICASFEGNRQLFEMLSSLARWRTPLKWYVLAFALPTGVFWVSLGGVLLYYPTPHALPSTTRFLQVFLLTLPFAPLWEELAWRAYALRKLQAHFSQLASALILGLYWAFWHVPLWLVTLGLSRDNRAIVLSLGTISIFAWSVVFTFLYNRSQSLPVVILLHGTYLAISDLTYGVVRAGQLLFVVLSAVLSVCLAVAVARRMANPQHF
jgi:membrane protease YdiL (CAAX protease family)